ncbi:MAG: aldo/keto reductase [Acidobacteria bacterium]|nr:aldo/keto reductase [Acidobacteriota bacterium]
MEFTRIANCSFEVSRIALGTWSIGGFGWGGSDDRQSLATIHHALEKGINLIDTAPVYGKGHSEELVGQALAERGKRDSICVATKFGLTYDTDDVGVNSAPERIRKELEDSLQRLRTDYIDIYQNHWPDTSQPFEQTAEILAGFLKEGKIRAIGVSNYSTQQMDTFRKVAPIHTAQPPLNLFERAAERTILPYCRENSIAVFAYGPLCRGLLSGRMRPDTKFSGDDVRNVDPKFQPPRYAQYLEAVSRLDRFALEKYGKRVIHLAMRWVLDQPGVTVALFGGRKPEHLAALDGVFGWKLDSAAMKEVDRIVNECVKEEIGPEFLTPSPANAA